ncbi:DUF3618 domain-containing protein [Streptomyces sp. TRM 70361]|uniref:DUF3618 domain-containing protein n=1 Tax=Streptomyces sp. TRM 70361 TaxID=3116553 RepID=UPI002E7C0EF1|nr:DUF3618 domain-containing protein [Streptomyces sp. TRM 70361]MEE1938393.1 DUF3618 domain-containing protein [Streptomyces sp. TRM 70361]
MSAPSDPGASGVPGIPADPDTPAELRARIERTRRELGDTLEELAARTDVKKHARRKAAQAAQAGRRGARPLAAGGGLVLALALAALALRHRHRWQRPRPYLARHNGEVPGSVRRLVAFLPHR